MKGGFYEVYGNQGMQAMSYQKMGDQMPIVQKYSSDDTMHDSSFTPKRVQGHRFGTYQGNPVIAQRYSNMSPSGQVMPHVVVQDMMEDRPNPLMIEDRNNRSKRMSKRRGRGRTIRGRTKKPKVEVIAEANEMNMPQILKFIQMLKDRKELDHSKKKSKKHKRIELDITDDDLDDPVPEKSEESEKNKKKKKSKKKNKSKKKTKAKKAKKSKSQKIKALTKRLKRMKEE